MILVRLFFEFAKVGLFSVGGGLATVPFLQELGSRTGWFTDADLTTMLAVSESTPGPIGVNMATNVGFHAAGVPGAVIATLGLIFPSIVVILIIAGFLQKFRNSGTVDAVFSGLRPASTALIAAAGVKVALAIFLAVGGVTEHTFTVKWISVTLAAVVFLALQFKSVKKLHPIVLIGASAAVGVLLGM